MQSRVFKLFTFIPLLFLAATAFSCSSRYIFLKHTDLCVDQPVHITLKDGSTVSGQITNMAQEKIDLLSKNGKHRVIEQTESLLIKEQILAIRREQQEHLEEIAKLKKKIESFDQNGRTSN